ncbi:MAG: hypothetical protein ACXWT4_06025 [Methylobacter sp.]
MKYTDIPTRVPLPFANAGTKNSIPTASQVSVTPGAASLNDGFPPLCFTPKAAGGTPPMGADINGIFNLLSANTMWENAGGFHPYDAAFSTTVGGYPKGAKLRNAGGTGFWISLIDDNTADPDSDTTGKWYPVNNTGITSVALTNANVTLTPTQFSKSTIILTGTLTGNVQIIFPTLTGMTWTVINNTDGAFSVTCKTAAGNGFQPHQVGGSRVCWCDGTGLYVSAKVDLPTPQFSRTSYIPVSGSTNTRSVSFTAPNRGIIWAASTINSSQPQPVAGTNTIKINGTSFGVDTVISGMTNWGAAGVDAGTSCTVLSEYIAGTSGSGFYALSQTVVAIFLPYP